MKMGLRLCLVIITIHQGRPEYGDHTHHHPENSMTDLNMKALQQEFGAYKKDKLVGKVFQLGQLLQ